MLGVPVGAGTALAEGGERDADQAWVALAKGVEVDAGPSGIDGADVVDEDVCVGGEVEQRVRGASGAPVEDDALLAGVLVNEETADLGVGARRGKGAVAPGDVALRRLDLDDARTKLA